MILTEGIMVRTSTISSWIKKRGIRSILMAFLASSLQLIRGVELMVIYEKGDTTSDRWVPRGRPPSYPTAARAVPGIKTKPSSCKEGMQRDWRSACNLDRSNPEAADLRKLDPVCTTRRRYYRRYLDPMKIEVQRHAIAAKAL